MKKQTIGKVLQTLRPYRFSVGLSVFAALFTVLSTLYIPILIGNAVDTIIGAGRVDFPALKSILLRMLIVVLLTAVCQWIMGSLNDRIVCRVVEDLRRKAFSHLQRLPVSFFDTHPVGDVLSRVIEDADTVGDGLLMGFSNLFTGVLTVLGTLVFMLTVNGWMTLVVFILTPVSLLLARFIARRTHTFFEAQAKSRGAVTANIHEIIGNEKTVRAYGQEPLVSERFHALNETLRGHSMKAVFYSSLVNPVTRFVNALVYASVGGFGAVFVLFGGPGSLTVGGLTCFLTYANQYTKPFNEISGVITELQNALVCAGRIFELIEAPAESAGGYEDRESGETSTKPETRYEDLESGETLPELEVPYGDLESGETSTEPSGHVVFSDVSFSYVPEKPLISGLSLDVKPGQHIAIVGRTGAGKTTLINLLMRFYDVDAGSISIDGTDLRDMPREDLRKKFGMVLQETWLKKGTVRENILTGKPDATEAEIIEAAKAAHADSFIRRLPEGYDTEVSEGGGNLSEGQKQLLCIARVMLSKPEMLILDEATSSIDTRTEMIIQEAFNTLMAGRTSFIVAHRLSTIRHADRILVMENGAVVEQGSHEELMEKHGAYYALYESQFKGVAV